MVKFNVKMKKIGDFMKRQTKKEIMFILFLFLTCSILGWIWELLYELLEFGMLANHGVLLGPWLPIYGTVSIMIYIILNRYKNYPIIVFMGSFVFCTIIEYITSWYLETYKLDVWWDYTDIPFNIEGRICLLASVFFGILGLAGIYVIFPKIRKIFEKFEFKKMCIFILILGSLFIIDFIHSIKHPNYVKKYQVIDIQMLDNVYK